MRRLNVQFSQIEECIRRSLFALPTLPANPPLRKGEELLLQLVLQDARPMGKENARIEFALIFDHVQEDPTGEISRRHWPDADRTWPYVLHCSETIPTIPFSLENLDVSKNYAGQTTAAYIEPRYGVPYADTRTVAAGTEPPPVSTNVVVVYPNHHAIIGATNASFDRRALAFEYPNGLVEKLTLRDHLLLA